MQSALAVTLLALLEEKPMHPYEMCQLLTQRKQDKLVKFSPGTVYRTIVQLSASALVEEVATERDGNRPERTVYAITAEGHSELRFSVAQMLGECSKEYPVFPVALGEAHYLPADEVSELLEKRLDGLRSIQEQIEGSKTHISEKGLPKSVVIHLYYYEALLKAEASWLETTVREIRSGDLEWPQRS